MQVAAAKDRLHRFAKFRKSFLRRMGDIRAREAPQDRFRLSRSEAKCRRILHHFIVLLIDEVPVDRSR